MYKPLMQYDSALDQKHIYDPAKVANSMKYSGTAAQSSVAYIIYYINISTFSSFHLRRGQLQELTVTATHVHRPLPFASQLAKKAASVWQDAATSFTLSFLLRRATGIVVRNPGILPYLQKPKLNT